ncbi:MAG: DUF4340 domain-containing protein [Chlorobi bacterium]|nr:DUF4340 domain-containing protein [Chlorobiota bacterium]
MSGKKRNGITALILVIAVAALIIIKFTRNESSNFRKALPSFNEESVNNIKIKSPYFEPLADLVKQGDDWFVNIDDKRFPANGQKIKMILKELNGSKVKSVVGTGKPSMSKYNTDDSLATTIELMKNGKTLARYAVGRFDYIQDRHKMNNGRPGGEPITYVSLEDDKNVYSINSMLPLQIGREIDDFRDKTLIKTDKSAIEKINFTNAAGDSFELEKIDGKWMLGNMEADSAKMDIYLRKLSKISGAEFGHEVAKGAKPSSSITIYQSGNQPITVNLFAVDSVSNIVGSSQYPDSFFNDKNNNIAKKLFVNEDELL